MASAVLSLLCALVALAAMFAAVDARPFVSTNATAELEKLWLKDQEHHLAPLARALRGGRRKLTSCLDPNPYLAISVQGPGGSALSSLADVQDVYVTVSGVKYPQSTDFVAVYAAGANYDTNPLGEADLADTGDTSTQPLTTTAPIKWKYVSSDPNYSSCKTQTCQLQLPLGAGCALTTCSGTVHFRMINLRTPVFFAFMGSNDALLQTPCSYAVSPTYGWSTPNSPLYAHLATVDSSAQSMRVTWISGDGDQQYVQYAPAGEKKYSTVPASTTTFTTAELCGGAATNEGWHTPGFVHTAVLPDLAPSSSFTYKYGGGIVPYSAAVTAYTPPAAGTSFVRLVVFGDMGKQDQDGSNEHYLNPGSLSTINRIVANEINAKAADYLFHIGDLSYATGYLAEWDQFLENISPIASRIPYMTAIGNHERDWNSASPVTHQSSVYTKTDSGGECGTPTVTYFPMPAPAERNPDNYWYSIETGPVHIAVIATEAPWTPGSAQYTWLQNDLAGVDRARTPWLIVVGHRPAYSSATSAFDVITGPSVDSSFTAALESLTQPYKVDLCLWGHVHNYERTCRVYSNKCVGPNPTTVNGVDVYANNGNYYAPVHAVVGMGGFSVDPVSSTPQPWSLAQESTFGYSKITASATTLDVKLVHSDGSTNGDHFAITK